MPDAAVLIKNQDETIQQFNDRIASACQDVPVSDAQIELMVSTVVNKGVTEKVYSPIVILVAGVPDEDLVGGDVADGEQDEEGLLVKIVSVNVSSPKNCIASETRITKVLQEADGTVQDIKIAKEGERAYFLITYLPPDADLDQPAAGSQEGDEAKGED